MDQANILRGTGKEKENSLKEKSRRRRRRREIDEIETFGRKAQKVKTKPEFDFF